MAWIILFLAGLAEIVWAVGLKYSEGFSRFWPSLITVLGMAISIWLLGEAASLARVASVSLIVLGLVGLKLSSAG
ncbi:SMR family transporter [Collimonas silvisoli]|uniref:SMR family transporter n=1 Tax=Collimonas silvisoli TaxID=2825884 RepID=UPI001B8B1EA6|nr:SMR family transporter [Collimonas silvisoli]